MMDESDSSEESKRVSNVSESSDELMAISGDVVSGVSSGKTLRFRCHIQKLKAFALVDSGSSHSFLSEQFAALLPKWSLLKKPVSVKAADGGIVICTHEVVNCNWQVQGHQFSTTFKILPLKCYDAIFGMDWLAQHSPMQVKWAEKWLSFAAHGKTVKIHYGTVPICRVPRAHGKGQFTLGKVFAECSSWQTTAGKELACRVLHLGHTANTLPCALLGPRQNKVYWRNPR